MSDLSNMKIAITKDAPLHIIIKLLEGLGYTLSYQTDSEPRIVVTWRNQQEYSILDMCLEDAFLQDEVSLVELEKMYAAIKSKENAQMGTAQQNERIDTRILEALKNESPLTLRGLSRNTRLDMNIVELSVERLKRQNYVEKCPVGYILTELAEDVCFGAEG
ncbi:hypothetical protein F971_01938 [Acinetobacter vivianii]|uniref:Uncharacterized protein n=1 Tax=Acinetobacter vivianii TaxID=1776742 RepID=N8UZF5_9GAMM|nr:hypothetical protein [Acinetobacter vivianii]ENU92951.1 hypothetical protein F971_01938 [Acinetobacter vivianii]